MHPIVWLVDWAIQILIILIVITSLLSWIQPDPRNPAVRILHGIVDPILHPIRSLLPAGLGIDLSPMVALVILWLLQGLLHRSLYA
jgi:YggT family protein